MTTYADYVADVVRTAPVAGWMKKLVRKFVRVLWDEGVVVDNVKFSIVHNATYIEMVADCVDAEDKDIRVVGRWEYDKSKVSDPFALPWELTEVSISDM